ncbi:NADPH-dependent 7-cyano-7-deazaguanine reductase [subsurface metagenome]
MVYEDRLSPEEELKAKKAVGKSFEPSVIDRSILKTISYEYPYRPIQMEHTTDEFTCLCPFSELPDQATITIKYVPNKLCIELKSLKYYFYSFRQVRIFHEHVVNKILEDLVAVLDPIEISVVAKFAIRGGISSTATASCKKKEGG